MTPRKTELRANSGSPRPGEPEYLLVGRLRRPHGLHGDLLMQIVTDFPDRLQPGIEVFIGVARRSRVIAGSRRHAQGLLVRFEGMDTPEQAGALRNESVYVRAENRPALPQGQYYHHQLLGLDVIDDQGLALGRLNEILQTGANDVYVVRTPDQRELLLPAIESVVLRIDAAARRIHVRVPSGLVPETALIRARPSTAGKKRNAKRG